MCLLVGECINGKNLRVAAEEFNLLYDEIMERVLLEVMECRNV
jgi:hypothetical protein